MKKTKTMKIRESRILQEGEATGHAHRACAGGTVLECGDDLYLATKGGTTITHEEHHPVTVPPGEYTISVVREYDHFAEEARRVID